MRGKVRLSAAGLSMVWVLAYLNPSPTFSFTMVTTLNYDYGGNVLTGFSETWKDPLMAILAFRAGRRHELWW